MAYGMEYIAIPVFAVSNCQTVAWFITCVSWCGTGACCFQCVRRITTSGGDKEAGRSTPKAYFFTGFNFVCLFLQLNDFRSVNLLSDDEDLIRRVFRSFETYLFIVRQSKFWVFPRIPLDYGRFFFWGEFFAWRFWSASYRKGCSRPKCGQSYDLFLPWSLLAGKRAQLLPMQKH